MGRMTPAELEQLKRGVSLRAVAQSQGHTLKKQGADSYVCRCPFHQENTPSCVITPSKNLYHCFGCGASGSVLDWLQHTERLTYPQTLLRLRELAGSASFLAAVPVPASSPRQKLADLDDDGQALLNQVIGFYHQSLLASPEAQQWLAGRGLTHPELVSHFRLGFAGHHGIGGSALLLRFVAWRRERNWSETTLKTQTHHQYRFILWAAERGLHYGRDITLPILEHYQRHLYQYRKPNGEPLSTRTQRSQLGPLVVWFGWMTRHHLLLADPASGLVLPRLEKRLPRHILSVADVEQVLALPDLTTLQGIRDRALMELLWSTGIRRGEVAVLEVYSVDASRHIVTIVQGKGKKDRVIPVGQRALRWLAYYLQAVRPQLLVNPHCPALFVALDGIEGLTPNGITNLVSHYIKASGIAKWGSCHLFRHAMATQMLENGADLRWIQAMLGHASVESTQIYTQVSIRALQAVHASTHPAERDPEEETGLPADLMADEEADNPSPDKREKKEEAERLGQIWVGDGAKLVTNQKDCPGCLISADGLRIYRSPSEKPNALEHLNPTGIQANFVQQKDGKITGNAHMSIEK